MGTITFIPPREVRDLLLPAEVRHRLRQVDHWHRQAVAGLRRLDADEDELQALDDLAARLRERVRQR